MGTLFCDDGLDFGTKTKYCKKCNRNLPHSKFTRANGANYLYYECRECSRKHTKVRKRLKADNPLNDPKNHICPICKRDHDKVFGSGGQRLKSAWVLDHDHVSGKFRGYICHSCNRGLGIFQDSIESLESAIEYLKVSSKS